MVPTPCKTCVMQYSLQVEQVCYIVCLSGTLSIYIDLWPFHIPLLNKKWRVNWIYFLMINLLDQIMSIHITHSNQSTSLLVFNTVLLCRYCGLAGESACFVNRRPWVQIPAVPRNAPVMPLFYSLYISFKSLFTLMRRVDWNYILVFSFHTNGEIMKLSSGSHRLVSSVDRAWDS